MTDASSTSTIYQRLAAVKQSIGSVSKGRQMSGGGSNYSYRGIEDILNAAHEALIENEIVIVPLNAEANYEARSTRGGSYSQWVSLTVLWSIGCPDGVINATTIGEAADTSDKATNKAHTAAFKVLLSQLFSIPYAGDDPDHSREELQNYQPPAHVPEKPEVTTEQAATIIGRLRALSPAMQDRCKPLVAAGRKVERLYADQYEEALAFLEMVEMDDASDLPFGDPDPEF